MYGYLWWTSPRRAFELVDAVRIDHFPRHSYVLGGSRRGHGREPRPVEPGPGRPFFDADRPRWADPLVAENSGITHAVEGPAARLGLPGMKICADADVEGQAGEVRTPGEPREARRI